MRSLLISLIFLIGCSRKPLPKYSYQLVIGATGVICDNYEAGQTLTNCHRADDGAPILDIHHATNYFKVPEDNK
jgi:hypothetical protein